MALLLLAIACIQGNKHDSNKTLIEKLSVVATLVAVLVFGAVPQTTLAFEVELDDAPARKLVAPIQLLHRKDFMGAADVVLEPEYSKRMANSVVAQPVSETKTGDWQSTRLAYADTSSTHVPKIMPTLDTPVVMQGEASYYSRAGCLGCSPSLTMANGQTLNDQALTMAIGADKSYLVGHKAKVTNTVTGQSVEVSITDTGGFYKAKYGNRVADLTIATKQAIGMHGGVGQVKVEVY